MLRALAMAGRPYQHISFVNAVTAINAGVILKPEVKWFANIWSRFRIVDFMLLC